MATIRKRNGRYQVQIRGKSHAPISKTFDKLTDARRWVATAAYEIEQGIFEKRPPPSFRTIRDLIDHYTRIGDAGINHSDPEHYRLKTLSRHLGNIAVSDLRGSDLARFRDERLQVIQPSTVAREIYLLRRIMRLAREEWDVEITDNPLDRFRIPDNRLTRERRLEPGEKTRLLRACSQARTPWLKPAVELAIETAMRRGELLNARYGDLKNGLLHIPITKTKVPRTIPLTPRALSIINGLPRSISGYLIPTSANALRLSWERAKRRANLEAQRFGWIGLFCSNAMPGSVGGDLIKAVYIVERCSGDRLRAVVSILVDRIIGLLSVLLACSIGCLFIVTRFPEFAWTVWTCALGVFVGCILLLSPGLRSLLRFEMLISHLPKRLGKFVAQLDDAVLQYRENLKGIGLWLLASPLIYSLFIGSVILMAQAIGVGLPWIDYLSIVPAAMVVQAIPLMPGGWGIGELAYGTLIAEFGAETLPGVPDAGQIMRTRGVALSVVHRIHVIAWSLLGGLLMLWDRQLHRNK